MQRNTLALMVMLVLCCTSTAMVTAKSSLLVSYGSFNLAESAKVSLYFDKEYKPAWKLDILVSMHFYNSTRRAIISLMSNVSGSQEELRIFMYANNDFDLQYITASGSAVSLISGGKWYNNSQSDEAEFRVLADGTYLTFYEVNATTLRLDSQPIISKFPASFPIGYVKAWGFDTGQSGTNVDSGYVSLILDTDVLGGFTTTILEVIVPIVILAVSLGVIGKVLEKLGKHT